MENTIKNTTENISDTDVVEVSKKSRKVKNFFGKEISKNAFWLWIAYQTIKGTLTTALIWVPLMYIYFTD